MSLKRIRSAKSREDSENLLAVSCANLITPPDLPFKEWVDQEIREENWTETEKSRKIRSLSGVSSVRGRGPGQTSMTEELDHFEDKQMINLPNSIIEFEWKPASVVFQNSQLEIYVNRDDYPDLISSNKHLLHSEFMRSFISSIQTLMYLGYTNSFGIEYVSRNFTPTTQDIPWKPWHHIYSNSAAGTNREHDPTINKIGKYIVRLYWMGTWRKIYVDDQIPIDLANHTLLPSVESQPIAASVEMEQVPVIEFWPYLLSKALLKIASLSWYGTEEVVDFDIISCLTGWEPQRIYMNDLPITDIWDIIWANTKHHSWPKLKSQTNLENTVKGKKSTSKQKDIKGEDFEECDVEIDEKDSPCYVLCRCNDMRQFENEDSSDFFPCWPHDFLIDKTRNIPLVKCDITADLKLWKRFRWLAWAAEQNIIPNEELLDDIKSCRIISAFKKVYEYKPYKQPSKIEISQVVIPEITEQQVVKEKKPKVTATKGKQKDDKKDDAASKKSKKTTDSKGSKLKPTNPQVNRTPLPDPSFWIDHEKLSPHINTIIIYYKPSKFKTKFEISSDPKQQKVKKEGGNDELEWKTVLHPTSLQRQRNEPIYIFTDSIDSKLLLINLSQTGYTNILQATTDIEKKPTASVHEISECEFCLASLVKRVKGNLTAEKITDYIPAPKLEKKLPVSHFRPSAHIVIEEFNWKYDDLGDAVISISTYGSKTSILELGPGRKIFKMWIKSEALFCVVQVLSDTPIFIGDLESTLNNMAQESNLLGEFCANVANNFGKLVEAFCVPEEFPSQLKAFLSSYKPLTNLTKAESSLVHDTFYNLLYHFIEEKLSTMEEDALKIVLLRWQNSLPLDYTENRNLCNCYDEDDFRYLKTLEKHVVQIQAFLRGCCVRSLMKSYSKSHKNYKMTADSLFNIYAAIFSSDNRYTQCVTLLRDLILHPDLSEISEKYGQLYLDMENVLTLKEIPITVKASETNWVPIYRQHFSVNSKNPLRIKISLFCDFDQYIIRVIDNDTYKEIGSKTIRSVVGDYQSNSQGYTVLCYAWSQFSKQSNAKLSFAIKKDTGPDKISLRSSGIETHVYKGMYMPNINNTICKYLIQVYSPIALVSLQFATSYEDAVINFRLYHENGTLLREINGKGYIIIPAINLESQNKRADVKLSQHSAVLKSKSKKSTRYSIAEKVNNTFDTRKITDYNSTTSLHTSKSKLKSIAIKDLKRILPGEPAVYPIIATVLYDSWPLNAEEWRNVSAVSTKRISIKTIESFNQESLPQKPQKPNSAKRSSYSIQKPYWTITSINSYGDVVHFNKDTKRETALKKIKSNWNEFQPDRAGKAEELRFKFLDANEILNDIPPIDQLEDIRTLSKNTFATKIIRPIDLTQYMIKDPQKVVETRKLKRAFELKMDTLREKELVEVNEIEVSKSKEKIEEFMCCHEESLKIINDWIKDIRSQSSLILEMAAEKRTTYIQQHKSKQEEEETKIEKKNQKGNKGKKDKKG